MRCFTIGGEWCVALAHPLMFSAAVQLTTTVMCKMCKSVNARAWLTADGMLYTAVVETFT